jgi:hypothetical protein
MTFVVEVRYKCDYCKNVSPVITDGKSPHGWIKTFSQGDEKHYCCKDHFNQARLKLL